MKRAHVVIGANFGDEGKGLLVDYHCAQQANLPIVIRFNGGAQAGHTVVTPDGRRHVFHHFGAGTLLGCPTFLSRFFVANPILWSRERLELRGFFGDGVTGAITIDPRAPLTTPYDMIVNQEAENARSGSRHGSCGVGINETIERNTTRYATTVADVLRPDDLREKLVAIRKEYLPQRLHNLGARSISEASSTLVATGFCDDRMTSTARDFAARVIIGEMPEHEACVFEGAQGLLLDEEHAFFPHVTRSKTGLRNVVTLAKEAGVEQLDVTYVTRAYMTRHGAGPFPTEDRSLSYADDTNVPHDFQGRLRFGRLDIDQLAASIKTDLQEANGMRITHNIAVTHLDQAAHGGAVVKAVIDAVQPARLYQSHGPMRTDVRLVCENCQASIATGSRCTDCGA